MRSFACDRRSSNDDGKRLVMLTITEIFETRSTDKAIGYKVNDGEMIWFPKSQISNYSEKRDPEIHTIISVSFWVPAWLVKEKSCEYFLDSSYAPSLFDILDDDGEKDQEMYERGQRERRGR